MSERHDYRQNPELADLADVMDVLWAGPSDVVEEAPSPEMWESLQFELSSSPVVSDQQSSEGPAEVVRVLPDNKRRRSSTFTALSFGVAAALLLLVAVPLGLAWNSNRGEPVASAAVLEELGDFDGEGAARLRGSSLEVDVPTLPTESQQFYELWMIDVDGEVGDLTSLGKITESATFELPENLDPELYSTVDISIELDDGNPEHSGNSVLRGELEAR